MFGGHNFGALYFGGLVTFTTGTTSSDVLSEAYGKELKNSVILSEVTGSIPPSDILSELYGKQLQNSVILSETTGVANSSEILSELTGIPDSDSEILSEVYGKYDKPQNLGYRIIVKNAAGDSIGELTSYRSVKFGKRLNNYGSATFDIRVKDPVASTLIDLRKNTIAIYREIGTTRTLVWAGQEALCQAELNEAANNWATVTSFTWFEKLLHRYTAAEKIFSAVDQGTIAATMITDTNTDDPTGITIGTVTATKDRDRTYNTQNVGEAIINLSNVISGFDFEITDAKAFNADSILGTDKTDSVVFRYGHNIKNLTILEDFTNPINRAIVLGEATDATTLQRVDRDDATLQTAYGLFEGRLQEMDVSSISTLQDKGDAAIRKYGLKLLTVEFDLIRNVSPSIDAFGVGDGIRLIVQDGMYDIDAQYRVFEWEVTFDATGAEKLKLTLGNFITI